MTGGWVWIASLRSQSRGDCSARIILPDRHRTNPRQMHVRKPGFLGPLIELRLHLGEVAFRLHLFRNVEARVAEARDHVLRGDKSVPADEAKKHLAGITAEPAAAFGKQVEQPDLVGGGPRRQKLAEAA